MAERNCVHMQVEGEIAVLELDNPPVNALSHALRKELLAALQRAMSDDAVAAIVVTGANGVFIGGADIREFGTPYQEPTLWQVNDLIKAAGKPVVAAIDGFALGGGFELALHCHWRIATPRSRVGLPEVLLGLMPGAGGTQYWTRLAGPRSALECLTTGRQLSADEARQLGLIDAVFDGDLRASALAFVRGKLAEGAPLPDMAQCTSKLAEGNDELFEAFVAERARAWAGLFSPGLIVECIKGACEHPLEDMLRAEREMFAQCADSPQARALMHLFFAERAAGQLGEGEARHVGSVGVIGAGTMGGGIAMALANAGYPVILVDNAQAALDRGMAQIASVYASSVAKGRLSQVRADDAMARISATAALDEIAPCDLVIEAVFEDMTVKQDIVRRLAAVLAPDAIIASNTSTLDIDELATAASHPERVVGMHFFSPAHIMKLLEVVRGTETDESCLRTVVKLGRKLGKIPVIAGNGEGFIGNYILDVYGREMDFLIEEGASPWQVDRVMREFGFAMGLFEMRDMAGLDVIHRVREQRREWERPGRYSRIADQLWEQERYGQKTGAGYYTYDNRKAVPDSFTDDLTLKAAAEQGIARRVIADGEIRARLLSAMTNAGARLLETGIAANAGDIDLVMVHGYGFPRHHGGPMRWADEQGLANVLAQQTAFHAADSDRPAPVGLLRDLVSTGRGWPVEKS